MSQPSTTLPEMQSAADGGLTSLMQLGIKNFVDGFIKPQSTSMPTDTMTPAVPTNNGNPFQSLATKPTANNIEFDSIVNDVLNNPTPIQGADTPLSQPKANGTKTQKSSPLFGGDLHFHIPMGGPSEQLPEDSTKKESIF